MTATRAAIEDLIREKAGCTELPPPDGDLLDALRITGDDVDDLMRAFATRFGIDLSGYRAYYHAYPEHAGFLAFVDIGFFSASAVDARRMPLSIALLEQATILGHWPIDYPNLSANERAYQRWHRQQTVIGRAIWLTIALPSLAWLWHVLAPGGR